MEGGIVPYIDYRLFVAAKVLYTAACRDVMRKCAASPRGVRAKMLGGVKFGFPSAELKGEEYYLIGYGTPRPPFSQRPLIYCVKRGACLDIFGAYRVGKSNFCVRSGLPFYKFIISGGGWEVCSSVSPLYPQKFYKSVKKLLK